VFANNQQGGRAKDRTAKDSDSFDRPAYKPRLLVILVLLLLPFAVFFWMAPFVGKYAIGNDYQNYWINMQLHLRFSLEHGTFPLYAPGFNAGWTSGALTLGQMYHPISWIAALVPGYWQGNALEIGTFLRLISLGLCNIVIYLFLRRLRLGAVMAFVISFITVYNLRMLDMFRYAASLENYTAFLMLCAAIGWSFLTNKRRLSFVLIVVCTYLLITGGHPQIAYIGLIGASFFGLVAPYYLAEVLGDEVKLSRRLLLRYYFTIALAVLAGLVLTSWYSFPFYFEYMRQSARDFGWGFSWSCGHQDTLFGSLQNFFNPYYSNVPDAFGGSSLIILAVISPLLVFLGRRVPKVIWSIWLISVFIFIASLGSNAPFYYYLWKYLPFAQSFRTPGRWNLLLPFLFLLMLAWASRARKRCKAGDSGIAKRDPLAILAVIALICFITVGALTAGGVEAATGRYTPARLNEIPDTVIKIGLVTGAISLLALFLFRAFGRFRTVTAFILITAVVAQVMCAVRYGTWVAKARRPRQTYEQLEQLQQEVMDYRPATGDWSRTVLEEHIRWSFIEPTLGRFAASCTPVDSTRRAYESMLEYRNIDHIYIEDFDNVQAEQVTDNESGMSGSVVDLVYNSYNNLRFNAANDQSCFFVFSYPFSKYWRAFVDGVKVRIYRCNGIEQCIWVPKGRHHIEFRYWSRPAIAGTMITCITAALIGIWLLRSAKPRFLRYASYTAVSACFALLFFIWFHSLYEGDNIGTKFSWSDSDIGPHLNSQYNIAYGKRTTMTMRSRAYNRHSSRGVDGSRNPYFGFTTDTKKNAWWLVDLGKVENIGKIVLFGRGKDSAEMGYPVDLLVSADRKRWKRIVKIMSYSQSGRWEIKTAGLNARYILLQTQETGYIALAEVEVYKGDI
jgi:hypothetical protein